MKLIPKWNGRLKFEVFKQDNFNYKDRSSKEFKRNYVIEIEKHSNNTFEAYYPKSILNQIKPLNIFEDFVYDNSKTLTKTLFYKVDDDFAFENILNKKETVASIQRDCNLLENYIQDEEERGSLNSRLESICESENNFQRNILDDTIKVHFNYGLTLSPDYYFNLQEESFSKKALLKLFPKSKFVLKYVNWMRHSIIEHTIQIEFLWGKENITGGVKPDWKLIEEEFTNGDFEVDNHKNLTLKHEVYSYDLDSMLLQFYNKHHVIETPTMKKEILHFITRID